MALGLALNRMFEVKVRDMMQATCTVKVPLETIEKIFVCLAKWYGERWERNYKPNRMDAYKLIWSTGLYGLSQDEIKAALKFYKKHAEKDNSLPPHVMEFFHVARGTRYP